MKNGWIYIAGVKFHYVNSKLHNDNGPAVIYDNGTKVWFYNGKVHREDRHAVEWHNGDKKWIYNGVFLGESFNRYTQEKFEQWKRLKIFT